MSGAPERARRDEGKIRAARAFDAAIREAGGTNEGVGARLGVGRTRVQRYRSDDAADRDACPTTADLLLADDALFDAWVARLKAERLALHGPPRVATLEREVCALIAAKAAFVQAGAVAVADGAVTPDEAPALEAVLDREHAQTERVRGLLRARAAR